MTPTTLIAIRRRELAQIHVAVKQLGMTDEDHRALLFAECKVTSAGDLDWRGRKRYLDKLKSLGFKVKPKTKRPLADDAQSKKIRALWLTLADAGKVHNRAESALAAYVKRQTGVAALQWLSTEQASSVIESLKQWQARPAPSLPEATKPGGTQ